MLASNDYVQIMFSKNDEQYFEMLQWVQERTAKHQIVLQSNGGHDAVVYLEKQLANMFFKHFDICAKEGLLQF